MAKLKRKKGQQIVIISEIEDPIWERKAAPDFQLALQTKDKIDKKIDKTRKLLKFNLGERKEKEKLIKGYKKHPDKYKPYDEPIGKALDTDLKKIKTNVFNYKDKRFDIKDKLKVIFQKRNVI